MLAKPRVRRRSLAAALAGLLLAATASCYHLGAKDIFEVAFQPVDAAALTALSDEHHHVRTLSLASAPSASAYWDDGDEARGVLVFFDGNGYGAESAMRRLLVPARALGLDLVVFNYYDEGSPRPSVADMRRLGDALFDAAASLPRPAAHHIYVGGHSLGATFAVATAADRPAAGVFVAAPPTTGIAMLHHQLWYTRFISLLPDSDYAQFNTLAFAPHVRAPALVVGSTGDVNLPPRFTQAVFSALPPGIRKREVILDDVPHSEYFTREQFWRAVSGFFELPPTGPLVGYLRAR